VRLGGITRSCLGVLCFAEMKMFYEGEQCGWREGDDGVGA
jgi:hypothetical protein